MPKPARSEPGSCDVSRIRGQVLTSFVGAIGALAFVATVQALSVLEQVSPAAVTYVTDVDYQPMSVSPEGNVTALVTAVDLQLGLGNTSTSGCEAADFAGFPSGNIAL